MQSPATTTATLQPSHDCNYIEIPDKHGVMNRIEVSCMFRDAQIVPMYRLFLGTKNVARDSMSVMHRLMTIMHICRHEFSYVQIVPMYRLFLGTD